MPTPDKQLSAEQSRQVAATIREEIARRRISRQHLAEQAKLSISTLEKALGGRRPFTLATTVRLEQALGVSLRKGLDDAPAPRAGQWRRRARQPRRLFAPRGDVARGRLSSRCGRRSATRKRSTPTAPRSPGMPPPHRWCSAKASGWMRPIPSSARSRCRTSPATSISSPTATASIA